MEAVSGMRYGKSLNPKTPLVAGVRVCVCVCVCGGGGMPGFICVTTYKIVCYFDWFHTGLLTDYIQLQMDIQSAQARAMRLESEVNTAITDFQLLSSRCQGSIAN